MPSSTPTAQALLASSRPLQATLSVAQPLFGALLAARGFPPADTLALLIIGSVAGLYAVFAFNDLLDYSLDARTAHNLQKRGWDIDAAISRHPLVAGLLTVPQQALWIALLGLVTLVVLASLSPVALALFIVAVVLEAFYCRLATVTPFKTIVAGAIVVLGVWIGWFAANGAWQPGVLARLGLLFFAWEIGGRNIPNDLSDVSQDRAIGIQTVPARYGRRVSARAIVWLSLACLVANVALAAYMELGWTYLAASTLAGLVLMLAPSLALWRKPEAERALSFFNAASFYPVALFAILAFVFARPLS